MRVAFQQPALPAYRVPFFRALGSEPGLSVSVAHGRDRAVPSVAPDGFTAEAWPTRSWRLAGQVLTWDQAQDAVATGEGCDVAVFEWNLNALSLVPAMVRARRRGAGVVLWGHGYSKRERSWKRWLRDRVARLADAVVVYNHGTGEALAQRGLSRDRVFVAPNSLDQGPIQEARARWSKRGRELDAFRESVGIRDRPVILFVSRLSPANRLDLLLHATDRVRRARDAVRVVIVGDGDREQRALEELATRLGLGSHVRLVPGCYDEEALAPWFMSAAVFCYPRNLGLSVLHAFGYGVPVVTTDAAEAQGPEAESLVPGENGLTFTDGQAEALATTLETVLGDDALRARLARGAERTALERFSMGKMVAGMSSAIRFAAARARATPGGRP